MNRRSLLKSLLALPVAALLPKTLIGEAMDPTASERAHYYQCKLLSGEMTVNEVRSAEGFERFEPMPESTNILESRRFMRDEICRVFNVPPHLLGDAKSTHGAAFS